MKNGNCEKWKNEICSKVKKNSLECQKNMPWNYVFV